MSGSGPTNGPSPPLPAGWRRLFAWTAEQIDLACRSLQAVLREKASEGRERVRFLEQEVLKKWIENLTMISALPPRYQAIALAKLVQGDPALIGHAPMLADGASEEAKKKELADLRNEAETTGWSRRR